MKKTIIILLSFVVAVVLCMSYIPDCFIRKYDLYSGFIGSILAAFVLGSLETTEQNQNDFLRRLHS